MYQVVASEWTNEPVLAQFHDNARGLRAAIMWMRSYERDHPQAAIHIRNTAEIDYDNPDGLKPFERWAIDNYDGEPL